MPHARKSVKNAMQSARQSAVFHGRSQSFAELFSTDSHSEQTAAMTSAGSSSDISKVQQYNTALLLHKLAQRLSYERANVRFYEALIFKSLAAGQGVRRIVSVDRLRQFRDEDVEHTVLLKTAIETLGADADMWLPDAEPSQATQITMSKMLTKTHGDILQCLQSVVVFARNDADEWQMLYTLFSSMGLEKVTETFRQAWEEDQQQLATLSAWVEQLHKDRLM